MTHDKAAVLAEVSGRSTLITGGATVIAGLTLNEWAAVVGVIATLFTVVVNWYYKHLHYKLAKERKATDDDD